ncbi:DNA methylase N-4 [uncultured Mediterranean phage uvDeep-CGR2-KM19-C37]|nr:DNA methylase N-4 [uncultured Mediterranean phage uvDeep-CGR2-KM19-C37]
MRDRIKSLRRVAAKDLQANPRNWRTHPPEQADAMRGLLTEIGWADAVLAREVDGKLQLIDGHLRKDVAPDAKVPVLVLDVDEAEAYKILATHDPIAAMATADEGRLGELLADMSVEDKAVQAMLDDLAAEHDIDLGDEPGEDPGAEIDKAAELQEKWKTELGQVWIVEGKTTHRVVCGDATDAGVVAALMNGETCDLCFTSPPYSQQRDYTSASDTTDWDGLMQGVFAAVPADDKTQVLVNLGLIHRDCEWIPYWDSWIEWMREQSWRRFGWYVWDHGGLPGDWNGRLAPSHEWVFHFNRDADRPNKWVKKQQGSIKRKSATDSALREKGGKITTINSPNASLQPTKIPDSVVRVQRHKGPVGKDMNHPAPFSVGLADFMAKTFADKGDLIFDPFLGSGTTLVACEQLGRRGYGIEIEPKYVAVTLERLSRMGCECRLEE